MKAHVSTMLTESGLSIASPECHFKGLSRGNGNCKLTSTPNAGLSVLTTASFAFLANAVRSLVVADGCGDRPAAVTVPATLGCDRRHNL
jgi:hypothetical protein